MQHSNLISDGLQLMLIGMSMVFIFLSVLVILTSLMQKILVTDSSNTNVVASNNQINQDEIAAVSAAVHQYRQNNSRD